jgi:mono/diheme cytochrome c family protein
LANATDPMSNARTIYAGRNKMPAFASDYTPEQIRDLGVFVATLAEELNK